MDNYLVVPVLELREERNKLEIREIAVLNHFYRELKDSGAWIIKEPSKPLMHRVIVFLPQVLFCIFKVHRNGSNRIYSFLQGLADKPGLCSVKASDEE